MKNDTKKKKEKKKNYATKSYQYKYNIIQVYFEHIR